MRVTDHLRYTSLLASMQKKSSRLHDLQQQAASGQKVNKPSDDPGAFAAAPDGAFSTNLIWDRLNAEGRLAAVVYDGGWVDVGTPAGLRLAEEALT